MDNCILSKAARKIEMSQSKLFSVIREFKTAEDCLLQMCNNPCDIVLMNLELPKMDGIIATREILQKFPDTKVIICSSRKNDLKMLASFVSGACSFIKIGTRDYDFKCVVENVLENGFYIDFNTLNYIFSKLPLKTYTENIENMQAKIKVPTKRELEVLKLISKGYSNPRIAQNLGITINTVKTQIRSILEKLNAKDRAQAAVIAVKHKFI